METQPQTDTNVIGDRSRCAPQEVGDLGARPSPSGRMASFVADKCHGGYIHDFISSASVELAMKECPNVYMSTTRLVQISDPLKVSGPVTTYPMRRQVVKIGELSNHWNLGFRPRSYPLAKLASLASII